jgi:hypothetical protein
MEEGTLSFSIDGVSMGIAYRDAELRNGPIFPAVALLHKAGFKYKAGLAIPRWATK